MTTFKEETEPSAINGQTNRKAILRGKTITAALRQRVIHGIDGTQRSRQLCRKQVFEE